MTIEIEIRNRDKARKITVTQVEYDKHSRSERRGLPYVIEPGLNWVGHVHALRDIVVTEMHPDQQGRLK